MRIKLLITTAFILINAYLFAQVNTTISFNNPQSQTNIPFSENDINVFRIAPPLNANASDLQSQNAQNKKLVFGENINTNISLAACKRINTGDKKTCKILIESAGAKTLNVRLTDFYLSPAAKMILYDEDGRVTMGPITALQNNEAKVFISSIFPGNKLVIELSENDDDKQSTFTVSRVTYGIIDTYENIFSNEPASGKCEQNITCFLGAWHDEAKSAVRLLISGNTLCSACLVNNTAQDGTPYVLTANHCVSGEPHIEHDISFVFFYRSKYCDSSIPVNNYETYNEGYVRAKYYKSDFALLEMKQKPGGEKYFYAGWSRDTAQGSFAACLHFPEGDLMKYSESALPVIDTVYGTTHHAKTMYWIRWTGKGVTENGSSGGVIFNRNKQVIGELYDGPSYCGAKGNDKADFFGGFYASWKGGGDSTNSLKFWLDPLHKNVSSINGAYINAFDKQQHSIAVLYP